MKYKLICEAILKTAEEEKIDYRDLLRTWVMMIEKIKVVSWNRNEFLICMEECKKKQEEKERRKEAKNNKKKKKKRKNGQII